MLTENDSTESQKDIFLSSRLTYYAETVGLHLVLVNIMLHVRLQNANIRFYFIVSGEISVYLVKIKVVSITSELISYHFTSD